MTAIEFNNISKQYRLGLVSTRTLSNDLNRWWTMNILHKEDPYLKIGSVNDRSQKADSDYVWALKNIDFKVEQGDVIGIIGKNGAGKSTLLKLLSRVTMPTTGTIKARGRIASLLEVGTGFHPELTGRENIYMNGAILGMSKSEITQKLDEIIDFAGVERYIDTPTKRYSSGMTVRLGFAIAAHLDPEILVVDEVLAVGDAEFQKKAIGKMQEISKREGRTVLFVSHNMSAIRNLCKSGVVLENGYVSFSGTAEESIAKYLSINQSTNLLSISQRKDRIGNGKIRIKNILLKNKNGVVVEDVFVGSYLKIEFHFDKEESVDLSQMIVACSLSNNYGDVVVLWVSDEMENCFHKIKDNIFSLEIPEINMRPNIYNMNFQISLKTTSQSDFCDVMNSAISISVLNNSFYQKGIDLRTSRGYIPLLKAKYIID
ncbi:MAG TPA: polysaccharide ABC transporter ATP-binding protein [Candidatus Enterocola sp.]|nr:polysaccharide ABC transporter ATP-binding protein [Candidatus Enterocola sp.]